MQTLATKSKISETLKRYYLEHPEAKAALSKMRKADGLVPPSRKGQKNSDIQKEVARVMHTGANHYNWKGGLENALMHTRLRRARVLNAEGSFSVKQWSFLKAAYNFTCPCCGKKEPEIKLTVDHIIPYAKGGNNKIQNIQPLCRSCNSSKGARVIIKYGVWRG